MYVRALTEYENSWGAEHKRPLHIKLNTYGQTIPFDWEMDYFRLKGTSPKFPGKVYLPCTPGVTWKLRHAPKPKIVCFSVKSDTYLNA